MTVSTLYLAQTTSNPLPNSSPNLLHTLCPSEFFSFLHLLALLQRLHTPTTSTNAIDTTFRPQTLYFTSLRRISAVSGSPKTSLYCPCHSSYLATVQYFWTLHATSTIIMPSPFTFASAAASSNGDSANKRESGGAGDWYDPPN